MKTSITKVLVFLKSKKDALSFYLRKYRYYYFFKRLDVFIHGKLIIRGGRGNNSFGSNLSVLPNCIIESFGNNSALIVGSNCCFAYGVVIAITVKIKIGDNVWIGEYTSLRDATHNFSTDKMIGTINDKHAPILIGNNVWIGKGCIILPGAVIGDNVIVAANSVVKGKLEANSLYGGTPATFIKSLE